jgi:hypothetical protein
LGAKPGQRCPGFRFTGETTSNGPLAKRPSGT